MHIQPRLSRSHFVFLRLVSNPTFDRTHRKDDEDAERREMMALSTRRKRQMIHRTVFSSVGGVCAQRCGA